MPIFSIIHPISCEIHLIPHCKSLTFGRDQIIWTLLLEHKVVHRWLPRWGIKTGKNISCSRKVSLRPVRGARDVTTVVPERCAKRVRDLTGFIVKTHAYPAAYGGFSDVWCCQLQRGQAPSEMVAVKVVRPVATDKEYQVKNKVVEKELEIWVSLDHQNIVPLYGITHEFGRFPAFVCPWAHNGTLSEYLEEFGTQLDMKARMTLLSDVAAGLRYLHSHNIAHGDLSGENVLITGEGRACLSDFGLSTLIGRASDTSVSELLPPGNIRWAAPELLGECGEDGSLPQLSSQLADIYSFGSIMLQTLTGKLPFHRVQRVAQIVIMIFRGEKPSREPGWDGKAIPDELWKFVEACWASPSERPSSEKILGFIKDQISRL